MTAESSPGIGQLYIKDYLHSIGLDTNALLDLMSRGNPEPIAKPHSLNPLLNGRIGGHLHRLRDSRNPQVLRQFAHDYKHQLLHTLQLQEDDRLKIRKILGGTNPDSTMFWTLGPFIWTACGYNQDKFVRWVASGDPDATDSSLLAGHLSAFFCFRLPSPQSIQGDTDPSCQAARSIAEKIVEYL